MTLGVGMMLGVALVLPFGWRLPDVYANMFGGVVGAIASIAGAFLVLNRQIAAAEDTRLADQAERNEIARTQLAALQRAVASALTGDLLAAKAFCRAQIDLVAGKIVNGKRMQNAGDMKVWCERQARMPMVAFDRLSGVLIQLGNVSGPLIHVYSEAARISGLVRGQLETAPDQDTISNFVPLIAEQLQQFIVNVETAINELEPHYAMAFHAKADSTRVGMGTE
jgi:hypothetical protein